MTGSTSELAVQIIGHRGVSHEAPENTLAAFRAGYEQGADAVELDIQMSKDGKLVVMHDDDTKRMTGVEWQIAERTYAELFQLEIRTPTGGVERIPLLEDVFPLVPEGRRLFIEVKAGLGFLPEFENVLQRSGVNVAQLVLIGFDYETMRQAKLRLPSLNMCWLDAPDKITRHGRSAHELARLAKEANLDGLDLRKNFPIDKDFVQTIHAAGLKLYTWTVDEPEVARAEMAAGVDGITTNRPGWMREQLGGQPK